MKQFTHHLRDIEFKNLIKNKFSSIKYARLPKFIADFSCLFNDIYYCIEYENSSRGMVTHTAKYLWLAQNYPNKFFKVLIIRSKNHQDKYRQDFLLSQAIIKGAVNSVKNLTFTTATCDNTEDTIIYYFKSFLSFDKNQVEIEEEGEEISGKLPS